MSLCLGLNKNQQHYHFKLYFALLKLLRQTAPPKHAVDMFCLLSDAYQRVISENIYFHQKSFMRFKWGSGSTLFYNCLYITVYTKETAIKFHY